MLSLTVLACLLTTQGHDLHELATIATDEASVAHLELMVKSSTDVATADTTPEGAEDESEDGDEGMHRVAVVIALLSLVIAFCVAYLVEEKLHWTFLPEAAIAVLVGMVVSGVFYLGQYGTGKHIDDIMKFDKEFFFVWLLPPIIFEAGYNMNRKAFFENIVPTILYAFIGTFVSTMIVGGIVYTAGEWGLCHNLGVLPSFIFGSLISATDPVTVLAVFQAIGVNDDLFSMVFGESVLNDAVAIVLYRTFLGFKNTPFGIGSVVSAIIMFTEIFAFSFLIGVSLGAACAVTFKWLDLRHHEAHRYMEATLTILFPWASYFLAESLALSGIVAIMFCGITMSVYAFDNLSEGAQTLTTQMYKVAAKLAESFVFIYLGMSVFAFQAANHSLLMLSNNMQISLVLVGIFAILVARLFNIYPCSLIVNMFRRGPPHSLPKVSQKYQFVMWWSGLRGGVAFAIAVVNYVDAEFPENDNGLAILQTTLFIAVFTIFVFGGSITRLARALDVLKKPSDVEMVEVGEARPNPTMDKIHKRLKPLLSFHSSVTTHRTLEEESSSQ